MAKETPDLSANIVDEASAWLIEFQEGEVDAAARQAFDAWLRRSPEHVRAYLEISAVWEEGRVLKMPANAELEDLIARAKAERNVYPLDPGGTSLYKGVGLPPVEGSARGSGRRWGVSAALAATVLVALGAGTGGWWYQQRNVY